MATTTEPKVYAITATVADGIVRLSGPDVTNGDTVEIPNGSDAILEISDAPGYYLYGAEIPDGGAQSSCWARDTGKGLTRQRFVAVTSQANNVVFAVDTKGLEAPSRGPILRVKPKG